MNEGTEPTHSDAWLNEHKVVTLSNRDYYAVRAGLRIPEDYFQPGEKVLSVGEGLSDFARRVRDEGGVDIIAADPIYSLGKEILTSDRDTIDRQLEDRFGDRVGYRHHVRVDANSLPDPEHIVAASVYQLPFKDHSFNKVVSFRLQEHLDLSVAVPEMIRVLREHGEVRMGDCLLMARPKRSELFPGRVYLDNKKVAYFDEARGFAGAVDALRGEEKYQVYTQMTVLPRDPIIREDLEMYVAGTLIIRNDEEIPQCRGFTDDEMKSIDRSGLYKNPVRDYQYLGRVYRVDLKPHEDKETGLGVYQLTEV
jgi:hypothetical protein